MPIHKTDATSSLTANFNNVAIRPVIDKKQLKLIVDSTKWEIKSMNTNIKNSLALCLVSLFFVAEFASCDN